MPLASTVEALLRLQTLSAGLLHISEADHPLTVVHLAQHDEPNAAQLALLAGRPSAVHVEIVSVASFFASAVADQAFHSVVERVVVERYRALLRFLTDQLSAARAYRLGRIDIDVFVLGRTQDGEWAGVAMKVIET
jgi:hypothetical protein